MKRVPKRRTKGDVEEEKPQDENQIQDIPLDNLFSFNSLDAIQKKLVIENICDQMCVSFGIEILKLVPGILVYFIKVMYRLKLMLD